METFCWVALEKEARRGRGREERDGKPWER